MDHDDLPIGRLLSRREALALLGVGSAAFLVGCGPSSAEGAPTAYASASPSVGSPCLVKPEATEGPFFFEDDLLRSDLRTDTATGERSAGVPLALTIGVSRVADAECTPLEGAIVDLWHCDAGGAYSGYETEGTAGQNFLRGFQRTNAAGEATFLTVYPGWYRGRAVHVHLKVRTDAGAEAYEFTSQLYFPDAVSDDVFAQPPYVREGGTRILNTRDGIYTRGNGDQLLLSPTPTEDGYSARFDFGLDLSDAAKGAPDGFGRRG